MSIQDLFKQINTIPSDSDYIPVTEAVDADIIEEIRPYMGELLDYVYFSAHAMPNYFYVRGFVWIDLWGMRLKNLKMIQAKELIEQTHQRMNAFIKEGNYVRIFSYMEKKAVIPAYIRHFDDIPEEHRYDIFRSLYSRSDYGFNQFELSFLERVFATRTHSAEWAEGITELKEQADDDGMLTIYRGESSKSAPIDKALSWTLSYEQAIFFATRFSDSGMLYEARVNVQDVLDYLGKRHEDEVLVIPGSISDYEKQEVYN